MVKNWRQFIQLHSIAFALVLIAALVLLSHWSSTKNQGDEKFNRESTKAAVLLGGSETILPVYGNPAANTTLVVFGDAACQYCRSLYPKLKGLVDISEGTVKLIYRPAPLIGIRSENYSLAEQVGECIANDTGRYHAFLDTLFNTLPKRTQLQLVPTSTIAFAAGMNNEELTECLTDHERIKSQIDKHHAAAAVLEVRPIPHTFVVTGSNVSDIVGDQRIEVFEALIRSHGTAPGTP